MKTLLTEVKDFLNGNYSGFIDGQFVKNDNVKKEIINPTNKEVIGYLGCCDKQTVIDAIQKSHDTFNGAMAQMLPAERELALNKFADLLERDVESIAQLLTLESGKLINLSRDEIRASAQFVRYYAGWATKFSGLTRRTSSPKIPGKSYIGMTIRQPIGVVAGIVPWNYPIMIGLWKIAAALSTGCTIILKPSSSTPLSTIWLGKLFCEAGFPNNSVNLVAGKSSDIGDELINNAFIRKLAFTGSVPTGIALAEKCIAAGLKSFSMELGGKNPAAFCQDMTAEEVIDGIMHGGMTHQGQICASIERAYIHESIIDDVIAKLPAVFKKNFAFGDPLDENTTFGPITNKEQYDKCMYYMNKSKEEGNRFVYGGEGHDEKGYFFDPTVILAKSPDSVLLHEEVFGPVVTIYPYKTEDELIKYMNSVPYGLTASVWTKDLSRMARLVKAVEAGMVWGNMHIDLDPSLPFGGVKSSGKGREFGRLFIDDYTVEKSILVKYDSTDQ